MNRRKKVIICLIGIAMTAIVLASGFRMDAKAGFGDFNDYDSGSDWDSGWDSDYDSSWDYDWDDDYDYDYDSSWDYDWDDDDNSSGNSSYGSSGKRSFDGTKTYHFGLWYLFLKPLIMGPFPIIFIIIILLLKSKNRKGDRENKRPVAGNVQKQRRTLPDRTDEISRIIGERDPLFTAPDFISFAKQVYMDIQDAWEKRDLDPVKGVLHQNLYQQTNRQIQKKIEDGIVNHLERISINTAYLTSYRRDREYEYLTVYLAASMIDYQVKEATGQVILGDKTTRWNLYYKMTFMRSTDSKTGSAADKDRGLVCPNCGAPLKGTSFGKCEYCDSIVTTGIYDWVLSGFGVVKNDTVDEGIKIN